jgi:hypothetical protein
MPLRAIGFYYANMSVALPAALLLPCGSRIYFGAHHFQEADVNFENAIKEHAAWKSKLHAAIIMKQSVDAIAIRQDDCCSLGKWLYGEGRAHHGGKASYTKLVARHAAFHQCAGRVADAINAKAFDQAETLIGPWSEYSSASAEVVAAIRGIESDIQSS